MPPTRPPGDRDRYLADLFAPADARPHLFALHAFNVEIARVRGKVSEPMPGEIRLQWWREHLRGEHGGSRWRPHPALRRSRPLPAAHLPLAASTT